MISTLAIVAATAVLFGSLVSLARVSRAPSAGTGSIQKHAIIRHVVAFAVVYGAILFWGVDTLMAETPPAAGEPSSREGGGSAGDEISVGEGLGMLGIAIATSISVLGASYAVAVVGSAALGAITEKPELFGRALVFIGLAEGLAIYGLIISILMLGQLE